MFLSSKNTVNFYVNIEKIGFKLALLLL